MTQHSHQPRTRSKTRASFDFRDHTEGLNGKRAASPGYLSGDSSGWEDEVGEEEIPAGGYPRTASPAGSASAYPTKSTPRRRRRPGFPVNGSNRRIANMTASFTGSMPGKPTRSTVSSTAPTPQIEYRDQPALSSQDVMDGALHGTVFTITYSLDILKRAILLLRYPLSLLACLVLLAVVINKVSNTLKAAFSPLCAVPGISSMAVCRYDDHFSKNKPQWADFPHLIEAQSKSFEELMSGSVGNSALSIEIKNAEMATIDLVTLVRISDLKAKNSLATLLMEFVDDAKRTGRGLQRLSSKVGGAVDSIMSVNDYALQTIQSARASQPSPWAVKLNTLQPWKPKRKSTDLIITETFEEAMNTLSTQMQRLIVEAETSLKDLNDLEERLTTLHDLVSREDLSLSSAKTDLLADLWTKLGGNRRKLRNFDSHLALLKDLGLYRRQARVHVVAALTTLRGMAEDMEDMRERVSAPDLIGATVPVEVHIKSIEMGLERLKEGRIRAKKLEQEAISRVLSVDGSDDEEFKFRR